MLVSALFCVTLDKGCNSQAGDIPVRDLSQEVVDIMQSYFQRKNVQTLADFAFSLIKALLSDIPESNPSKTPKKAKVDPPSNYPANLSEIHIPLCALSYLGVECNISLAAAEIHLSIFDCGNL